MKLEDIGKEEEFYKIIEQSNIIYKASFGEGYWEDHFTYLYDLIENYQAIYPDLIQDLLFDQKGRILSIKCVCASKIF